MFQLSLERKCSNDDARLIIHWICDGVFLMPNISQQAWIVEDCENEWWNGVI